MVGCDSSGVVGQRYSARVGLLAWSPAFREGGGGIASWDFGDRKNSAGVGTKL
jgi:hypothetical protein